MVVVFDFDLTLTAIHSSGVPDLQVDYFGKNRLYKVKKLLSDIKQHNHEIYINTRGITTLVQNYMKHVGLNKYVTKIYGAKDITELQSNDWPDRKVTILKKIKNRHPGKPIYFYDDMQDNIMAARAAGFIANPLILN